jgi:hypothetical protein
MTDQEAWQPISREALQGEVSGGVGRMSPEQRRLWDAVSITPEKWQQEPYGKEGGGFWVVALLGPNVVWYNDIEEGFNCSRYSNYGTIDEYGCNQDELEWAIQALLNLIMTGQNAGSFGPPESLALPS